MEIMGLVSLLIINMDYLGVFAWLVISSPLILRGGFPFLKFIIVVIVYGPIVNFLHIFELLTYC